MSVREDLGMGYGLRFSTELYGLPRMPTGIWFWSLHTSPNISKTIGNYSSSLLVWEQVSGHSYSIAGVIPSLSRDVGKVMNTGKLEVT